MKQNKKMSSLIKGKTPKKIVIDYYDDLICQVEIYAEKCLKRLKDDTSLMSVKEDDFVNPDESNLFYKSIERQFDDPYSGVYKFEPEAIICNEKVLIKDFMNSQKVKVIGELKELQRQRLEEIEKATKNAPKSVEEALFSNNFSFLIKLERQRHVKLKFKLLTLILDFYLDEKNIQDIK